MTFYNTISRKEFLKQNSLKTTQPGSPAKTNSILFQFRTITKADLQNYISTHYSAPRIVLAAAGGVDHDELTKLADENFKGLKTTVSEEEKLKPCRFTGSEVRIYYYSTYISIVNNYNKINFNIPSSNLFSSSLRLFCAMQHFIETNIKTDFRFILKYASLKILKTSQDRYFLINK